MRVAALYDIHGNVPALEAVLADAEAASPDAILVGGDVAAGPLPRETLERLRTLAVPARFVRGNADREVVERFDRLRLPGPAPDASDAWVAQTLTREDRDFLADFEESVVLELDGLGPTLFCHGSPRSDEEILTPATSQERLRPILAGVAERVVVCGHTHMQFDRVVDEVRVVNAGSVGMPYERVAGAYWAILGPAVELRRTEYDRERAAERIRASGWPGAAEFATGNVLSVPSPDEACAVFERLALERERPRGRGAG